MTECGKPDIKVGRKVRSLVHTFGYIECKDIGTNLKKEEEGEQLKRYRAGLDNLILTNYVEFRFYVRGELQETALLAKESKGGAFVSTDNSIGQLKKLFAMFFAAEPVRISKSKELASKMGGVAKLLRDIIGKTFEQEGKKGQLHSKYEAFKKVLLHDLKENEFADMYAQTICYGLFAAHCNKPNEVLTREGAAYDLPKTNPFLRNIFGDIAGPSLDDRIAWLVDDLIKVLNNAKMGKILEGFGRRTKKEDPVVHFYEIFLGAYDPKLRKARGVYYTPEPVVSYIVRSVDWILKEKFGLKQGLADCSKVEFDIDNKGIRSKKGKAKKTHRCLILDPACGTGTFLFEVIRQIYKQFESKRRGEWAGYVKEHLLPRLFGFELMMAPYAICHMKLGLQLAETGYEFESDERVGVYLTNTLEEVEDISQFLDFARTLAVEANEANRVKKDLPIMVVLGNPPYAGHSTNPSERIEFIEPGQKYTVVTKKGKRLTKTAGKKGVNLRHKTFIGKLIQDYYYVDGERLDEKNTKWLQDDYVKFIRYGQYRIEQRGSGVLAFITNHGYLDNRTFRGMRQHLIKTFSEIYILDLHGSKKKEEVCSDGSKDVNVFDIEPGVSIGIFVKEQSNVRNANVYRADLWGERKIKHEALNIEDLEKTKWQKIKPEGPFYLFRPEDRRAKTSWNQMIEITKVCPEYSLGLISKRDKLVTHFTEAGLVCKLEKFFDKELSDREAVDHFGLKLKDKDKWDAQKVRKALDCNAARAYIELELYRPFDYRYIVYHELLAARLNQRILSNFYNHENYGLVLGLQGQAVSTHDWNLVTITNRLIDQNIYRRGGGTVFPLYRYPSEKKEVLFDDTGGDWANGKRGRVPNLARSFIEQLTKRVGLEFLSDGKGDLEKTFGPEDVFHYIYGVFHSPEYRKRYVEFLKIDFPRVPWPKDRTIFTKVCKVGHELVNLHLMKAEILESAQDKSGISIEGDNIIEKGYPKFDAGKVYINEKQYFESIRADVCEFRIGGYRVCEKWLKDRRGRKLSYDDIAHYKKIVMALGETIHLMKEPCLSELFD